MPHAIGGIVGGKAGFHQLASHKGSGKTKFGLESKLLLLLRADLDNFIKKETCLQQDSEEIAAGRAPYEERKGTISAVGLCGSGMLLGLVGMSADISPSRILGRASAVPWMGQALL